MTSLSLKKPHRTLGFLQTSASRFWLVAVFSILGFTLSDCRADAPPDPAAAHASFLDNGVIRVGVDLDLGGAITWVSKSGDKANLVNSWDWGRQIQMSFYSGPVPFIPDGKKVAPEWRGLGWNPIQCGDCFKNRAKILEHRNDGKEILVRCTPMQWPLDNVPGECTFESRLTLDGNTIRAKCRLINRRSDLTQYPARLQELPAIYTNAPWWHLMTYTGDKPFTNAPLTQIPAKMPWSQWNSTENWSALVDDKNQGLGIWEEGANLTSGGFAGKPGAGGAKDSPTGYIAPNHADLLDNNIDYSFSYTLIVGSLDEIRKYVYDHANHRALPDYHFDADRQHWQYHDATDAGWPIRGELDIRPAGRDPYFTGPLTFWNAADAPKLRIEAAFDGTRPQGRVRWQTFSKNRFTEEDMLPFPVNADGQFHVYEIDLTASPKYTGAMTGLRIDPEPIAGKESHIRIKRIWFPMGQPVRQ